MPKANLKAAPLPPAKLSDETIERIAEGLALTLSQETADLEGLFLLAKELGHNCHDWLHVDVIANALQRQLLIYTEEFDEAEQRLDARLRAEVTR